MVKDRPDSTPPQAGQAETPREPDGGDSIEPMPDTIGSLARAHEHLETAAKYLVLGGNPVQPGELAAHLRDVAESLSLALFAVHPWPWAGSDTEIEATSQRAARLASELKDVLEELKQKPSPWGAQAVAEVLREPTDERAPLVFSYPPYMDAVTAEWIFADQRRRGLVSEDACRRADTHGVLYVPQDLGPAPSPANTSSESTS